MAEADIVFPEIEYGEHFLTALNSLGWATSGMSGAQCFTWSELAAWQSITGWSLSIWEAGVVMALSSAYAGMLREAADLNCQAPFKTWEQIVESRGATEREVRATLSKFKRNPKT